MRLESQASTKASALTNVLTDGALRLVRRSLLAFPSYTQCLGALVLCLVLLPVDQGLCWDVVERLARDTNCTLRVADTGLVKVVVPASRGTNTWAAEFTFKPGQEVEIRDLLMSFGQYAFSLERKGLRPAQLLIGTSRNNETTLIFTALVPNEGGSALLVEEQFHNPPESVRQLRCTLDSDQCLKAWHLLSDSTYLRELRAPKSAK